MAGFLDLVDALNLIDRIEGVVSSIAHADWRGATRKSGPLGILTEAGSTALGTNTWTFRVARDGSWSGADIEHFLKRYGVIVWGRRVTGDHFVFTVKARQANWAEYLLSRRGIAVEGRSFNPLNAAYAQPHMPGDQPPAWADQGKEPRKLLDSVLDIFD